MLPWKGFSEIESSETWKQGGGLERKKHADNSMRMSSELFLEQTCPLRVSQCRGLCSMYLVNVLLHESPLYRHFQASSNSVFWVLILGQ